MDSFYSQNLWVQILAPSHTTHMISGNYLISLCLIFFSKKTEMMMTTTTMMMMMIRPSPSLLGLELGLCE